MTQVDTLLLMQSLRRIMQNQEAFLRHAMGPQAAGTMSAKWVGDAIVEGQSLAKKLQLEEARVAGVAGAQS